MKFATHAHNLFDALRKGRIKSTVAVGAGYDPELERVRFDDRRCMEQAPVFVLGDRLNEVFTPDLFALVRERMVAGRLALPYHAMLLELSAIEDDPDDAAGRLIPWIIQAVAPPNRNGFVLWTFGGPSREVPNWERVPIPVLVVQDPERRTGGVSYFPKPDFLTDAHYEECVGILKDTVGCFCGILLMMDSPAVEIEAVRVPREFNRGRSLLKKSRIPDHTILKLPKVVYVEAPGAGGSHATPIAHWRRAHKRILADGREVKVRMTVVAQREGEPPPPPPVTEIVTRKCDR